MKKYWIFILIAIILLLIVGTILVFNNTNQNSGVTQYDISGQRLSTNVNEDIIENRIARIAEYQNEITEKQSQQKEISSFSTEILDDTPSRLNNISITCSTLNNTVVEAGQTFSFNEIVGKPTSERGYQEAKIIVDHEAELGIGGRKLSSK